MNVTQTGFSDMQPEELLVETNNIDSLISALDQWTTSTDERRAYVRFPYRVKGAIELDEGPSGDPGCVATIYTRDVGSWGLGFFTTRELPVANDANLFLPRSPQGTRCIKCTILRCRKLINGWYEGGVLFDKEQPIPDEISMEYRKEAARGIDTSRSRVPP